MTIRTTLFLLAAMCSVAAKAQVDEPTSSRVSLKAYREQVVAQRWEPVRAYLWNRLGVEFQVVTLKDRAQALSLSHMIVESNFSTVQNKLDAVKLYMGTPWLADIKPKILVAHVQQSIESLDGVDDVSYAALEILRQERKELASAGPDIERLEQDFKDVFRGGCGWSDDSGPPWQVLAWD